MLILSFLFFSPTHILFATTSFDLNHPQWAEILKRYVDNGLVDYSALKKSPQILDSYLEAIQSVSKQEYEAWSRNEKIVFWVNAYNAITVKVIVDHYPIKRQGFKGALYPSNSIRQIPGVWDRITYRVLGKVIALNEIEHGILRKEFREPRIHFALVCASLGCPVLRSEPYVGERLDTQLNDQVRRFLADPKKMRYDSETDTLHLSPIFKWFGEDFEKMGSVFSFVKQYLPEETAGKISGETKIEWLGYDWSLNEGRKGI